MPLPRIKTHFRVDLMDDEGDRPIEKLPPVFPDEVLDIIYGYFDEFERARLKNYHYRKFMNAYSLSLHKTESRLRLYTRELKGLAISHGLYGSGGLVAWVRDSKVCKRKYDYAKLKGIWF